MAIGGIVKRTELYHGEAVEHEFLFVTVSFDHDIVDGAPAARFIHRFKRMVEQAKGLQSDRRS
jgi:pyruvate/2-oxoglutarate dehydrogenase complex dihydrolipoamide acyltransferase (E2) component